jgi:hypothetical protein
MHPPIVANSRPGEGADGTTCIQRQIFETTTQSKTLLGPQNRDQSAGDGTYMGAVQSAKPQAKSLGPLRWLTQARARKALSLSSTAVASQSGAGPSRLFEDESTSPRQWHMQATEQRVSDCGERTPLMAG